MQPDQTSQGYNRSEGFFKGYDDVRLFFQAWEKTNAKGTIVITHGQGEHSEAYIRLLDFFKNDCWNFYAWDLRGHGRSDGRRGYAASFDEYGLDFEIFIQKILADPKRVNGPLILLSHSMGGLIQLKTLVKKPTWLNQINGQVCSSPLLGLALPVPAFKSKGASLINKVLPGLTMYNEITNDMLTRDLDVIRQFETDELRHHRISSAVFLGFLESFEILKTRGNEIQMPTLFLLPENDPIVSTPASRSFFETINSSKKDVYVYRDCKHELFNEINRATVFRDLKKYLDSFVEQK